MFAMCNTNNRERRGQARNQPMEETFWEQSPNKKEIKARAACQPQDRWGA